MVQQSQYRYIPPTEEMGSPAAEPPGMGRKPSAAGRKRPRQGRGRNPGLRQARRPVTAQQPRGPGTLSPASARDKAEPTIRHPVAQWGLGPSPTTAMTMLEQDSSGGRQAPGGAQQRAGGSAYPACTVCCEDGSIGFSPAMERCRTTTPLPAVEGRRQQGPNRVCRCYKHLEKCEHRIVPHEVKYQLHNVNTQTLFHCNCTRRLARCLRRARYLSGAEVAVLADHIAKDCFDLEPPTDCSLGEGLQHKSITATQAVLVPARHLKKTIRHWGPLHAIFKAKHPDWKTQDNGGTLYERCLRLTLEQKLGAQHHMVP